MVDILDLSDLVNSTRYREPKDKLTDLMHTARRYPFFRRVMGRENVEEASGIGVQFTLLVDDSGTAAEVPIRGADPQGTATEATLKGRVRWATAQAHAEWDARELNMNQGGGEIQIWSWLRKERLRATASLCKLVERRGFGIGDPDQDHVLKGLRHCIVPDVANAAGAGFYGIHPTGFSSCFDVDCSDTGEPRYRNYTWTYTTYDLAGFFEPIERAGEMCKFETPYPDKAYKTETDQYSIYTVYDPVVVRMKRYLRGQQHVELGWRIDNNRDSVMYNRREIQSAPELENLSDQPIMGVNWGTIHIVFLTGVYFKQSPPLTGRDAHNMVREYQDLVYLIYTDDRRGHFYGRYGG